MQESSYNSNGTPPPLQILSIHPPWEALSTHTLLDALSAMSSWRVVRCSSFGGNVMFCAKQVVVLTNRSYICLVQHSMHMLTRQKPVLNFYPISITTNQTSIWTFPYLYGPLYV